MSKNKKIAYFILLEILAIIFAYFPSMLFKLEAESFKFNHILSIIYVLIPYISFMLLPLIIFVLGFARKLDKFLTAIALILFILWLAFIAYLVFACNKGFSPIIFSFLTALPAAVFFGGASIIGYLSNQLRKSSEKDMKEEPLIKEFSIYEINSKENLLDIQGYLHDAKCNDNEIKYDTESGKIDIIFDRQGLGDSFNKKIKTDFILFQIFEYPIVRSLLHLEDISSCKLTPTAKNIKVHTFDGIRFENDKYRLYFYWLTMDIDFKTSSKGFLKDLELSKDKIGRYTDFEYVFPFGSYTVKRIKK